VRALKRGEIPSIGELTSFVVAAQHGSFTRAAGELNLTQGAVSRQIRELETHLGIRLFERIRQRVVLTDAGKMYLSQVKKALDDLADATLRVASFSNSTTLNLVALPTFAARWLVPRLPNFQKANPKIMVHITARQAPIDSALEPFDAAVFHGASHWPGTISQYLMDDDIVAVCSPKLNARRAIKTPADVVKFPLVHKMGKPNRWAEWMAEVGIASDGLLHGHACQNFAMVAQAAVAGLGIALLPRYLIEDDIAAKRLEIVADEFVDIATSYYLILPETRASASAVQAFAKWLTAEARIFNARSGRRLARKKPTEHRPDDTPKMNKIPLDVGDAARPRTIA
jgi:LysR family glycine cleavage system transcriptional activator